MYSVFQEVLTGHQFPVKYSSNEADMEKGILYASFDKVFELQFDLSSRIKHTRRMQLDLAIG
jgi:hypothetical protein